MRGTIARFYLFLISCLLAIMLVMGKPPIFSFGGASALIGLLCLICAAWKPTRRRVVLSSILPLILLSLLLYAAFGLGATMPGDGSLSLF